MLVSNPNINKQVELYEVSNVGFIINQSNILLNELPVIYYADILKDNNELKTNTNYNQRNNFFNNDEFKFNEKFLTNDNYKKQIDLLLNINEQFINNIIENNKSLSEDQIIYFFNKYIDYLVDSLTFTDFKNNLEIKYKLLLKNSELLNYLINYQSQIITNIRNLYNDLVLLK